MIIKICGIRRPEDIIYVNEFKPDYIGFVFAESKRRITAENAAELKKMLSQEIKAVGVFVNCPIEQRKYKKLSDSTLFSFTETRI